MCVPELDQLDNVNMKLCQDLLCVYIRLYMKIIILASSLYICKNFWKKNLL